MSIERLGKLRKKVDALQRDSDRAQGVLDQTLKQLREEFGCDSIEEGEKLLKKLEKKEASARAAFEEALAEFEEKWNL